ncbi:hypothetical protein BS50DRAFT_31764 [Corynespora cassiicola Philippines]|uniref:Uncharacterized protein n=1 Tax=Corynespora cassiicola Philippines TaxID=1448308 RepID=A0A2T2PBL0_CORCC|nr:hypothetical protein BS50DRAFT_31764 [Corynespora cassiicola Philippines]
MAQGCNKLSDAACRTCKLTAALPAWGPSPITTKPQARPPRRLLLSPLPSPLSPPPDPPLHPSVSTSPRPFRCSACFSAPRPPSSLSAIAFHIRRIPTIHAAALSALTSVSPHTPLHPPGAPIEPIPRRHILRRPPPLCTFQQIPRVSFALLPYHTVPVSLARPLPARPAGLPFHLGSPNLQRLSQSLSFLLSLQGLSSGTSKRAYALKRDPTGLPVMAPYF